MLCLWRAHYVSVSWNICFWWLDDRLSVDSNFHIATSHENSHYYTFPPWQTGCVPLQVLLCRQVLSAEPIRLYPASQLKRSRLLVLNSSPPRRAPWGGIPGSPQIPGFTPIVRKWTMYKTEQQRNPISGQPNDCSLINWADLWHF